MSDDKTVKNFLEEGRAEAKELINDIMEDVFDDEMPEIIDNPPPKTPKRKISPFQILVPVVLVLAAIIGFTMLSKDDKKDPSIITVPAITKIINIEELSDLLEVIYAATKARGYSIEQLEAVRAEKAAKRGAFDKKILLKEVIED